MPDFTVRVVLKDGEWEDYDTLYAAMEILGFEKTITGSSGTVYELPPAEYAITIEKTAEDVRDMAEAAADTTTLKNSIFVTESVRRVWTGLVKA